MSTFIESIFSSIVSGGIVKSKIQDGSGKTWMMEDNGGMPINIQDQTTEIIDVYFYMILGTPTLSTPTTISSRNLILQAGHGVVSGNVLVIKEGYSYYQGIVTNVATNTITMDCPLDHVFTISAIVLRGTKEMNIDGSSTPQIFRISPVGLLYNVDINKLVFNIQDDTQMDSGKFGGLTSLTNGVMVRKKDGIYKNIFNTKNNGDLSLHCSEVIYDDKAPSGVYGVRAIKIFNGQEQQGVAIRLDPALNDELQIIIQDNLTGLSKFNCIAQGHATTGDGN